MVSAYFNQCFIFSLFTANYFMKVVFILYLNGYFQPVIFNHCGCLSYQISYFCIKGLNNKIHQAKCISLKNYQKKSPFKCVIKKSVCKKINKQVCY